MSRAQALVFGAEAHLVGVLDVAAAPLAQAPGVLFLNAGLEHRVGPRGLYVGVSQALVAAGYATLRFDYAGMGESRKRQRPVGVDRRDEMLADVREAVDTLIARTGCPGVVLFGLCSGADDAHHAALADPRVVGVAQIDGYALPTGRFKIVYYAQRLGSPRRWANAWQRWRTASTAIVPSDDAAPAIDTAGLDFFDAPPREQLVADLRTLIARPTRLFVAFSGGIQDQYNYRSQFRAAFPEIDFKGYLSEHFLPVADHTFSRLGERAALIERLLAWLEQCVSARQPRR